MRLNFDFNLQGCALPQLRPLFSMRRILQRGSDQKLENNTLHLGQCKSHLLPFLAMADSPFLVTDTPVSNRFN